MYIIIVGCGSVGAGLANTLSAEGHNVVVVDRQPGAFDRLGRGFNGLTVTGTGIDEDVLRRAGIEKSDALAAVTSSDNTNIMVAQIAQQLFKVPRVVARVFDPDREYAYKEFGLDTVSPTHMGVIQIRNAVVVGSISRWLTLGGGEVEIIELPVGGSVAGRTVASLCLDHKFQITAVTRGRRTFIPEPDAILAQGDTVIAAARIDAIEGICLTFGIEPIR